MLALAGVLGGLAVDIGTNVVTDLVAGNAAEGGPCPGQPSREEMATLLNALDATQRAELQRLWAAFGDGREVKHPLYLSGGRVAVDPAWFSAQVWGGTDCTISSAKGRALYGFMTEMIQRHLGPGVATGAVLAPTGTVAQVVDTASNIVTTGVQAGVAAAGASVAGSVATQVNQRTDYSVLPDYVLYGLGGLAVVALILLLKGR